MFCCFCFVLNSVLSPASAAEYQLHHLYPDHCERLHLRGGPGAGHGRDHVHLPLHVWRVYLPTVHHWSEVTDREMVCFYMVGSGSFKYMIATEAPNSVFTTLLLTIQPLPTPHVQLMSLLEYGYCRVLLIKMSTNEVNSFIDASYE